VYNIRLGHVDKHESHPAIRRYAIWRQNTLRQGYDLHRIYFS